MTTAASTPGGFKNSNLGAAKSAKNDEFYTQWPDTIEVPYSQSRVALMAYPELPLPWHSIAR